MIGPFFERIGWSVKHGHSLETPSPPTTETELWRDPNGSLTVSRISGRKTVGYRLCFSDEYIVDVDPAQRVVVERSSSCEISRASRHHILADQVLPRILAHDGTLVLHAGAIRHGKQSIVFIGESGHGKSTLVASFDQTGYPLLGDDALIISKQTSLFCAAAVYPSLRLFPDSLDAVCPQTVSTAPIASYTLKLRVDVPVTATVPASEPNPIDTMFFLGGPSQTSSIQLRRLTVASACMALIKNSFALDPTDTRCARRRLEEASALADQVPAYAMFYPHDYAQLPNVQEMIFEHLTTCRR